MLALFTLAQKTKTEKNHERNNEERVQWYFVIMSGNIHAKINFNNCCEQIQIDKRIINDPETNWVL